MHRRFLTIHIIQHPPASSEVSYMQIRTPQALIACLAFAAPLSAAAHSVGASSVGFDHGILHPFTGIDHLLALFAAGLWASQLTGPAHRAAPAVFLGTMILGVILGMTGIGMPHTETVISLSALALGLMIYFATRMPASRGILLASAFAVFHGQAHGTAIMQAASGMDYAIGLIISSLSLLLAGMLGGRHLSRLTAEHAPRLGGAAVALSGLVLVIGG